MTEPGAALRHRVTDADTAAALGSGDVPVLGTPRLIAWMEAATLNAVDHILSPGQTTVGTAIQVHHHRATSVGDTVVVTANLTPEAAVHPAGRRLAFAVQATDHHGHIIATGRIERAIVNRERFIRTAGTTE